MNKDSINLPAIPLRGITIFPNMIIHFDVGREKSISALEESMLKDSKIFLVSQIDPEIEDPKRNEIYSIGTICKIKQILKLLEDHPRDRAFPAYILYSDDQSREELLLPKLQERGILPVELRRCSIGPTIGTHVGPGALGIAYVE